jgi:hypothetical protein
MYPLPQRHTPAQHEPRPLHSASTTPPLCAPPPGVTKHTLACTHLGVQHQTAVSAIDERRHRTREHARARASGVAAIVRRARVAVVARRVDERIENTLTHTRARRQHTDTHSHHAPALLRTCTTRTASHAQRSRLSTRTDTSQCRRRRRWCTCRCSCTRRRRRTACCRVPRYTSTRTRHTCDRTNTHLQTHFSGQENDMPSHAALRSHAPVLL